MVFVDLFFDNITAISWRSGLLLGLPEKTTDMPQVTDKLMTYYCIEYTSP